MSVFPILDFSTIVSNSDLTDADALADFGKQFVSALSTNGTCYIKHHGIENDLQTKYMDIHRRFFTESAHVKSAFEREMGKFSGWVDRKKDIYNHEGQPNEVEAYFYLPSDATVDWPNAELELYNKKLFAASASLAGHLCDALSLGLGLEKSFMRNAHKLGLIGTNGGNILLRKNYYLPCSSFSKPGDTRFGAHTDLGTMSFLFQDEMDGLEVEVPGKGFVPATPIPGTVVVLSGDILQRWTSDAVQAAKHRVVPPAEESRRNMPRQSIAFFVTPDRDLEIKPLDGSKKYQPITCMDFMLEMCEERGHTF